MRRLYSVAALMLLGATCIDALNWRLTGNRDAVPDARIGSIQSRVTGAESTETTKHSKAIPTVEAVKDGIANERNEDISSSNDIQFVPQTRPNIERIIMDVANMKHSKPERATSIAANAKETKSNAERLLAKSSALNGGPSESLCYSSPARPPVSPSSSNKEPTMYTTTRQLEDGRGVCDDDRTFRFNKSKKRNCKKWVAAIPSDRCDLTDPITNEKVEFFCPSICNPSCNNNNPTTAPSTETRGVCEDDPTFRFNKMKKKNCKKWVAAKPSNRCNKTDPITNEKVKVLCPSICNPSCSNPTVAPTTEARDACKDDSTFRFNGKKKKNCKWVAAIENPSVRCKQTDPIEGKKVGFFCPSVCNPCCTSRTVAPSFTATATPTATPSATPTATATTDS